MLVVAVVYQGLAFPLLFSLLPKAGNSNTQERIKLIDRFIGLFGRQSIDCLTADREFVEERWIEVSEWSKISYYIRTA